MNPPSAPWRALALAAGVFAVDRLTKLLILRHLGAFEIWEIIPGFFHIIRAENTGMAFSLLADLDSPLRPIVLIGVAMVLMGFVVIMLWQAPAGATLQRVALALVLGGALGNLYDRIFRGSVTDFLDVFYGNHHWPTFNVADSAITIGAALLAFDLLLAHSREKTRKAAA